MATRLCGRRLDSSAHICAFFDSEDEHYSAILPYFAEGLLHGEQVINIYEEEDMEYETRLGFVTRHHQCTLMCAYDTRKFSRAAFKDILSTHPQVLIGDTVVENPYYVAPMEFPRQLMAKGAMPLQHDTEGADMQRFVDGKRH